MYVLKLKDSWYGSEVVYFSELEELYWGGWYMNRGTLEYAMIFEDVKEALQFIEDYDDLDQFEVVCID